MPLNAEQFNIYLNRIQYPINGDVSVSLNTLRQLHEAHVNAIPFENLDIHLNRPIKIDAASIFTKLVENKRGGYCYEINELFALALEYVGFSVYRMSSRVLFPVTRPRTHQIIIIALKTAKNPECWLADTGFSGNSLTHPILLPSICDTPSEIQQQQHGDYIVRAKKDKFENIEYVLQTKIKGLWVDLYSFNLMECLPIDFEMQNFSLSHQKDSPFVLHKICAKPTVNGRAILVDKKLTTRTRDGSTVKELSDHEYSDVLRDTFNIDLTAEELRKINPCAQTGLTSLMSFFNRNKHFSPIKDIYLPKDLAKLTLDIQQCCAKFSLLLCVSFVACLSILLVSLFRQPDHHEALSHQMNL